jgi:hypothetical protein
MPHKRYLKSPKTIPWSDARNMKSIPRGVWVEPRVGGRKTAAQLGIKVTESGVKIPGQKKPFKSLATAIRQQGHRINSVAASEKKLESLQSEISELHGKINDNWNSMSDAERGNALAEVANLRDRISPLDAGSASFSESMAKALSDLDEAVAEGNQPRLCAKLVQVHHDVTDRRGELRGQLANMPRWRGALTSEKRARDIEAFEHIDTVHGMIKAAGEGDAAERLKVAEGARSLARRLASANAKNLKATARRRLEKAAELLEEGKVKEGRGKLREANRSIASHISNHSWLYTWRLGQIAKSKDAAGEQGRSERFKKDIVKRQARLYSENLDYWLSPASHEPINPEIAAANLEIMSRLIPNTKFRRSMRLAAGHIRKGNLPRGRKWLEKAGEQLA